MHYTVKQVNTSVVDWQYSRRVLNIFLAVGDSFVKNVEKSWNLGDQK